MTRQTLLISCLPSDDEDDDPVALFSSLDISPSPDDADATGGNNSGQPDNTSPPPGGSHDLLGFTMHNSGPSDADNFCREDTMPWDPQEVLLKLALEHLSAQEQVTLTKLLNDNIDVSAFTTGALGKVTTVEHVIPTGDAPPFCTAVRRFSQVEKAAIDRHVSEILADGIIEVSHSPYRSSPVIVPKPRGGWRFCVNYRRLNYDTRHDSYAIPNITQVPDDLGPATHFSLLDMRAGYWQLGVSAGSSEDCVLGTLCIVPVQCHAIWTEHRSCHLSALHAPGAGRPATCKGISGCLLRFQQLLQGAHEPAAASLCATAGSRRPFAPSEV